MNREEIMQALSVASEYVLARGGHWQVLLGALLQQGARVGIRMAKNGSDVEGFLVLCRAAFEAELKRHNALKGGS